ncbi:MAG: dTDP-glucose 4,6-dehydratase [Angelakisella sp.]|nr:dTDP-glucose 4,6-dehydratase [Angelakisella sp.]
MQNLLVTGGAGFIGSNFVQYMLKKYPAARLINLDALTYAGNLENLKDVSQYPNHHFIKGDIRDVQTVDSIFEKYEIDCVVHFAAESHVDRSINNPYCFVTTNVLGTQILLNAAKNHWKLRPDDSYCRDYRSGVRFIQISTDEVYGALGATGKFTEEAALSPNSPYAASKASADMMVRAYEKTYGLPINITRCSNNYGPYQFPEKLIPLMIHNCISEKPLPVYGDGLQIRDWVHVTDHCSAIDAVLQKGEPGEVYNIGGNIEKTNIEIVKYIIKVLGKSKNLVTHVPDRPGHDRRYSIDYTKITTELGWSPAYTFEKGIAETIQWYLSHRDWMDRAILKT